MERVPLTGKRLKLAREAIGFDNPNLLASKFKGYNREKGYKKGKGLPEARRTIIDWEEKNIPARSVKLGLDDTVKTVADFFGVEPDLFTEEYNGWNSEIFQKKIRRGYNSKFDRDVADTTFTHQQSFSANQSLINWDDLAHKMETLENDYVYGDRNYTLKDIFIFQNAEFKLSGSVGWEPIANLRDYFSNFDFDKVKAEKRPIVVFGDFGVGKTSFLKMFSSWLIKSGHDNFPIFIPLKVLPIYSQSSMEDAIAGYLSETGVFDFRRINRKILFLFDGFDELNLYRNDKKWIMESFEQLSSLLRFKNVHVIISSRPLLFLKEESNIPINTPMFRIQGFDNPQIQQWLTQWKALPDMGNSEISYQSLKERKLISLVENPLLLYMTAKIFDTELKEKKNYSKGHIFKLFYDWTIRGKFKSDQQVHNIPEAEEYRVLLQNIAIVIFQISSDEFIRYDELKKWIMMFQNEIKEKHEKTFGINEIVLVAHFFKIKEHDELKYIEFAHKSFREYLVAEKIFFFFQESITQTRFDRIRWFTLGRKLPQTEEIKFLKDLLYTLPNEELVWLYDQMKYHIPLLFALGHFPKILKNINFPNENEFNIIYYRSLNLSTLAYIVGNIIYFKLADKISDIKDKLEIAHSTNYIFHLCHSTPGTTSGKSQFNENWGIAKTFLSGINLSKWKLDGIDFDRAELDKATFNDSSLRRCSFGHSRLIVTDFSFAICDGADFSQSYCHSTIFTNTYLHQVTFKNAQFYYVHFSNTEFLNVDFSGSTFEKCTFEDCIFQNVIVKDVKTNECIGLPDFFKQ